MKPPRRLGKGLADLVELQNAASGEPADDDGDAATGSVLHLLSTETLERPAAARASAAAVAEPPPRTEVAAAPPADARMGTEDETGPVDEPGEEPGVEDEQEPATAPLDEPPTESYPGAPTRAPDDDEEGSEDVTAPVEPESRAAEAVSVAVPEPAVVLDDEWFDPPIAAFSPVAGFQRVEAEPAPAPAAPAARAPEQVAETPPPRPEPARAAPPPEPEPRPEPPRAPEPTPVVDDPVIVDDGLFLDDVVVGSFLPDVDLDG